LSAPNEGILTVSDYFYYYTGAPYTKASGVYAPTSLQKELFGVLKLSSQLSANLQNAFVQPVSFTFSDSVHRIYSTDDTVVSYFQVSTDNSAKITRWDIYVGHWNEGTRAGGTNPSANEGVYDYANGQIDNVDWAYSSSPGSWVGASEKPSLDSVRRPFELRK
jgi:hypothetical protein